MNSTQWGRVDASGAVYVRIGEEERVVGEYPDATPEEALAYFERKFADLDGQVTLLEQRAKSGAPANDLAKVASKLADQVANANAVGDLASLATRVEAVQGQVAALNEEQSEAQKAAVEAAIAERGQIVAAAEAIAARDLAKAQWKQVGTEIDELFAKWQAHQTSGPRLPKGVSEELWKRFRAARTTIDTARKAFYATQDSVHKDARAAKAALVAKAEALAPKGADGIPAYRALLDEWKNAGRAGRKDDDRLWDQFKAAGDALYQAKAAVVAAESTEFSGNLEQKLELLTEAEGILRVTYRKQARELLQDVQRRWDRIGKVPREQIRAVEDRLRKVEDHVRRLDDDHWKRSDPTRVERSEGFAGQLEESIAKLEQALETAKAGGDKRKIADAEAALATQKAWLAAVRG